MDKRHSFGCRKMAVTSAEPSSGLHPCIFLNESNLIVLALEHHYHKYLLEQHAILKEQNSILTKLTQPKMVKTRAAWHRRNDRLEMQLQKIIVCLRVIKDLKCLDGYVSQWLYLQRALKSRDSLLLSSGLETGQGVAADPKFRARIAANLHGLHLQRLHISQGVMSSLPCCSDEFQEYVATTYWNCEFCSVLCCKEWASIFGITPLVSQEDGKLYEGGFVCLECVPKFYSVVEAFDDQKTTLCLPPRSSEATTGGSGTDVSLTPSKSKRKKKKKKVKRNKSGAASQENGDNCSDTSSLDVHITPVDIRPDTTEPPKISPSNEDLLDHLMKTGSIMALNDFLDETEGEDSSDGMGSSDASSFLEKPVLEEFRDECLAITRADTLERESPTKISAAARKGYHIAISMIAALDYPANDTADVD